MTKCRCITVYRERVEETRQKGRGREKERKRGLNTVAILLSLSLSDCWYAQSFLMLLAGLMPVSSFLFAIYLLLLLPPFAAAAVISDRMKKKREKNMYSSVAFSLSRCCRRLRCS